MDKTLYLLGGGGHGRVVVDALGSSGVQLAGILQPDSDVGTCVLGVPILGDDEVLDGKSAADVLLVNGLGANPNTGPRRRLFEAMKDRGFAFAQVQHNSVIVGLECTLGEGSHFMAGVVVQNSVRVGQNAVINTRASIDHECVIGDHAFVSPGAILCGNVVVGESAFVGAGAIAVSGVKIGSEAIVGAGAVVTRDVAPGSIVVGNPATTIGANS